MTEPMNPAEIAAMVAALRLPETHISPEESADMLEALAAENAALRSDYEDAFVRGMAHGQKVMPKGTFNIVDSPELATLRASETAAVERAEALQAQLAAMTEARDAAVARVVTDHVTKTHMLGMHAAELSVDFCRLGLFPSVGVDDSGEFVLGPFSLKDGKIIHGCASVFWDAEAKKYCWSAYIDFGVTEIRGQWPVDTMPDEIAAAIRALAEGTPT